MQSRTKTAKRRDLRLYFNSNAIWANSGYAVFMNDLLPRLVKDGWAVAMCAFAGLSGSVIEYKGITTYPVLADPFGSDALAPHSKHFNANVVINFSDIWTLNPAHLQQLQQLKTAFIPYVPIDQSPVPPQVLDRLRFAYKILSFSKFGQKELEKSGFSSTLILEGVDTNVFKPLIKAECQKRFGLPENKFVFGMIGANKENPSRKGWQEALEAFKLFTDKHPDSILFYQSNQNIPSGFPILDYAKHLGILDKVFHLDEYMSLVHVGPSVVNEIINSCDVIIHPSATEGFGLIPVEAQSAGVPVIVNRSTAMPEMLVEGVTGLICESGKKFFSPAQGYWNFADVQSLYEKMEEMFTLDREKMGEAGRNHVLENFNIDKQIQIWINYFEKLQDELLPVFDKDKSK